MNRILVIAIACVLITGIGLVGCGQKKAASTQEAISTANSMQAKEQKVDYLVNQAKAFINSKDYQGAIQLAQYVLNNIDSNAQKARDIITKAKNEMTATTKKAAEDLKKQFGGFGK